MSKKFTMEEVMHLTETWLVKGDLNAEMQGTDFQFISPFWRSSSRKEFIDKFQNTSIYKDNLRFGRN